MPNYNLEATQSPLCPVHFEIQSSIIMVSTDALTISSSTALYRYPGIRIAHLLLLTSISRNTVLVVPL